MDRTELLECREKKRITILGKLVTKEKENICVFFVGMTSVFLNNIVCLEATGLS